MANMSRFDPTGEMASLRAAKDLLFEGSVVSPLGRRTIGGDDMRQIRSNADIDETSEHGTGS